MVEMALQATGGRVRSLVMESNSSMTPGQQVDVAFTRLIPLSR
jgi:hypothetical protein